MDYISFVYFFHHIFVLSQIQRHFYIHTPFFSDFQIWTFCPQKPKNSNLTNSFLVHYPKPKINQKSPKDPKLDSHHDHQTAVHILLEDPAYRWFDLACTDLACFFQKPPNLATHLKSHKKETELDLMSFFKQNVVGKILLVATEKDKHPTYPVMIKAVVTHFSLGPTRHMTFEKLVKDLAETCWESVQGSPIDLWSHHKH